MKLCMLCMYVYIRYTQCEAMVMYYKKPILLIEFEENKSFSLQVSNQIYLYVIYCICMKN